ncbi:MAG: transposase [Acidimicrobiales bacterium]
MPKLKVTTDGKGLVSHAGARLLAELAERLGIAADLSAALAPIVKGPRRHAPGRVLVDLAVMLADGHELVSDLRALRDQPDLFAKVASQPTAWRLSTPSTRTCWQPCRAPVRLRGRGPGQPGSRLRPSR